MAGYIAGCAPSPLRLPDMIKRSVFSNSAKLVFIWMDFQARNYHHSAPRCNRMGIQDRNFYNLVTWRNWDYLPGKERSKGKD
jgi:hypothetical protein